MNYDQKRRMAVARELELLRKTVEEFEPVVVRSWALATECKASLERLESIQAEDDNVDRKIRELEDAFARRRADTDHLAAALADIGGCSLTKRQAE